MNDIRKGPYYLYSPYDMPTDLANVFFTELGEFRRKALHWVVDRPGGPFADQPEDYNENNFAASTLKMNREVDEWLITNGAFKGETIIFYWV